MIVADAGTYALSVLDVINGERSVKHYYIRNMDNGGYYVSPKHTFTSLTELVQFHSGKFTCNSEVFISGFEYLL